MFCYARTHTFAEQAPIGPAEVLPPMSARQNKALAAWNTHKRVLLLYVFVCVCVCVCVCVLACVRARSCVHVS